MKYIFSAFLCFVGLWSIATSVNANSQNFQELINQTEIGGTVYLKSGVYEGNIVIQKAITILVEDQVILKSTLETEPALLIKDTEDVFIYGLQINTAGTAVEIKDSQNVEFTNIRAKNVDSGMKLFRTKDISIRNSEITGNDEHYSNKGNGISIYNSSNLLIEENRLNLVQDGIYIENVNNITIRRNLVENSRYGTHFMYSEYAVAEKNSYMKNVTGLMVMMASNIELNENKIDYQEGFNGTGITLYDVQDIAVKNNQISGNRVALAIQKTSGVNVRLNLFQMNQSAVETIKSDESNLISNNFFVGNIVNVRSDKTGVKLQQNYYDDYSGIDLDGDGVGEDTYVALQSFGQWMVRKPVYQYYVESPGVVLLNQIDRQTNRGAQKLLVDETPIVNAQLTKDLKYKLNLIQLSGGIALLITCLLIWRRSVCS